MIGCRDECGAKVADEKAANLGGWSYLEISKAYRCPSCWRSLRAAAGLIGTDGETTDTLPPGSLGAIKKATAESILPPSLKG